MGNIFNVESSEKSSYTTFVLGNRHPVIPALINSLKKSCRILLSVKQESNFRINYQNVPNISFLDIKNLGSQLFNTPVDYALLFLEDEELKKAITQILKMLCEKKSKIVIIVDIRQVIYFSDFIKSFKDQNVYFLFCGDIFGKDVGESVSIVSKIIQNVKATNSILMTGDDLSSVFPISNIDITKGIYQILFESTHKQKFFYLFYAHPQTVLSLYSLLKKIQPELEIKYENTKEKNIGETFEEIEKHIKREFKIIPSYINLNFLGFKESVKIILKEEYSPDNALLNLPVTQKKRDLKSLYLEKVLQKPKKLFSKSKHNSKESIKNSGSNFIKLNNNLFERKYFLIPLTLISSVFLSAIIILALFTASVFLLRQSINSFASLDFSNASKQAQLSSETSSTTDLPITLFLTYIPVFKDKFLKDYLLLKDASSIIYITSENVIDLKDMVSKGNFEKVDKTMGDFKYVYFKIQDLTNENSEVSKTSQSSLQKLKKYYQEFSKSFNPDFLSFFDIIPNMLGYNNVKKYLILFQNNGELRPNGGFIGSVAELSVSNGRIKEFQIRDVYELDGQLKAHIEPNYIIRKYLKPHLYLRDSNFDLDFEESASRSALIYSLETGKKADGVIALNYNVLQKILKETGEINLYDYKTKINDKNASDFIQDTIESSFFPGSNQKKNLLQAIFNQLSIQLLDNQKVLLSTIKLIPGILNEKQAQFTFRDNSLAQVFEQYGLSGSINPVTHDLTDGALGNGVKDTLAKNNNTFNDILFINEANIGINKANTGITRTVDHEFFLNENPVRSKTILNLISGLDNKNDYKVYLRLLTALGSHINSVKIDGVEQKIVPAVTDFRIYESKGYKPPNGLEVDQGIYENYQTLGFVTLVPKQKTKRIEIEYTNLFNPEFLQNLNYSLHYIKQSGTDTYPFKLIIHLPQGYKVKGNSDYKKTDNSLVIKENIDKDKLINLEFTR